MFALEAAGNLHFCDKFLLEYIGSSILIYQTVDYRIADVVHIPEQHLELFRKY